MRKGVKRHHMIIMFFAVCWMAGLGLLLFIIQPPSASAMLKELTVPSISTESLNEQEPGTQVVGAGEQAVTALTQDPVSSVIPKQVPSAPMETPIKTPDNIAEPDTSALEVPQLFIDIPAERVHKRPSKKLTVLDELQPTLDQVQPETLAFTLPAPSVLKQPEDDHAPTLTKISVSQASRGHPHQRKQSVGVPRLPLNEKSSPYPAQAVGTPQVTTASGGGSGGQASGSGSAGSTAWWAAVPEASLFADPNESSERIAARYLLGFDQWCQPPPEEPPMEGFFSNF